MLLVFIFWSYLFFLPLLCMFHLLSTIPSYDLITEGWLKIHRVWRENIKSLSSSFLDYNHGLENYSSGQTQSSACFYMAHELRIGYKEEGRRQEAKESGRREENGKEEEENMWQTICGPKHLKYFLSGP